MYRSILVAVENSPADRTILTHVRELASLTGAELLLVHVADGWAARTYEQLKLKESEEMSEDRRYLDTTAEQLRAQGLSVSTHLALGDPPREIVKVATAEKCDLIAMTTHGHRLIKDLLLGSTIDPVRHRASVPVLLVRAPRR